mgnify:CR=1 FL=1
MKFFTSETDQNFSNIEKKTFFIFRQLVDTLIPTQKIAFVGKKRLNRFFIQFMKEFELRSRVEQMLEPPLVKNGKMF